MDQIPAAMDRHLDVIQCHKDGGILLGASGLTGRYWLGSLWYYANPDSAPDVEKCTAGVQLEAGFREALWLDNTKVLVGLDTGGVAIWELVDNFHTFIHLHAAVEHDDIVTSISVVSGNKNAVSASADKCVKVWDLETMYSTKTYKAHADTVECVSCHPTEPALFVSCSADGKTCLWDSRKTRPACVLDTSPLEHSPKHVTWQPGSHNLAVGGECGQVVVKDTRAAIGTPLSFRYHSRAITKLEFCKESPSLLASASEDCSASVLSLEKESGHLVFKDCSHQDFVTGLSWKDTDRLFTCSWDSKVLNHSISKSNQISDSDFVVMDTNTEQKQNCAKKPVTEVVTCNGNGAEQVNST